MLQVGRALFREGHIAPAHRFFDLAASAHPDSPDAAACLGYASHRLGNDAGLALLAPPRARARCDLQRGADLPRQPALRSRRDRGGPAPARAHPARGPLRRARHLAAHRAQEDDLPPARRRSGARPLAHPAGRGGRRARRHRHAARRGRGAAGRRRRARSAPARAVRHAAERAARHAEEARAVRVAPGRDAGRPVHPRATGTRSCCR